MVISNKLRGLLKSTNDHKNMLTLYGTASSVFLTKCNKPQKYVK
nr:MAG TPA: hypothetical protein [Caudoviricetes sp.]